jgi:hypothetical protein
MTRYTFGTFWFWLVNPTRLDVNCGKQPSGEALRRKTACAVCGISLKSCIPLKLTEITDKWCILDRMIEFSVLSERSFMVFVIIMASCRPYRKSGSGLTFSNTRFLRNFYPKWRVNTESKILRNNVIRFCVNAALIQLGLSRSFSALLL